MEKIAIQLWKKNDIDEDKFKNFLVEKVTSRLADIVSNYQVNIVDKRCTRRFRTHSILLSSKP